MSGDAGEWAGLQAIEVFRTELVEPQGVPRVLRLIGALTFGLITWGAGPTNPGGRQVVIVETASGHQLAAWPEQMGDDARLRHGQIDADLRKLSADEFAERWIETSLS